MKIAIPKERRPGETRVAASPDLVKKFVALGVDVVVEKGAGLSASFTDVEFKAAGATIARDAATALKTADVILKVQRPIIEGEGNKNELSLMKKGAVLIGHLGALYNKEDVAAWAKAGITSFSLDLMPRISRAQSMDILSSQNNLAGYKAVIDAAAEFGRGFPMMMTAAGTIAPAKVFIMGVGVAGLQAIATAKRLGAVVTATDVRPATKEQVESLGGKFLVVDPEMEKDAQTEGGYAKEMPPEYFAKQKEVVIEHIKKQDVVITTALIPGRPAPKLITADMVKTMREGSIIVDLAVETGGNCELSERGKVVTKHGVKIIGHDNVPGRLPTDASSLYARNILNFLTPQIDAEKKVMDFKWDDETISGTLVTRDGAIVHPMLTGEGKVTMDAMDIKRSASEVADTASDLAAQTADLARQAAELAATQAAASGDEGSSFLFMFTVFVLAVFIGFYVVWSVTPALHSPLMSVTNAISSVIIVGGLIAAGPAGLGFSKVMGFVAVTLASVNIFGGFIVTQRMLAMFKKKR